MKYLKNQQIPKDTFKIGSRVLDIPNSYAKVEELGALDDSELGSEEDRGDSLNVLEDTIFKRVSQKCFFYMTVSLGMVIASDAVDIYSLGFIMSSMTSSNSLSVTQKELLSSAVFLGMVSGGIIVAIISDKVGRRLSLITCLMINALAGLSSGLSPNVEFLICFRILTGFAIGGAVPICFSFGVELFPQRLRGFVIPTIASFWMVGSIYTSILAWLILGDTLNDHRISPTLNWRTFAAVSSIPAIVALCFVYENIPESPLYCVTTRNYDELRISLNSRCGANITVKDIAILSEKFSKKAAQTPKSDMDLSQSLSLVQNIYFPNLFLMWFCISFGSFGMITWISELYVDIGVRNVYANTLLFVCADIPANLISILYIDKFGRKKIILTALMIAIGCSTIFSATLSNHILVVILSSTFNASLTVAWNGLECFSSELFDTSHRATALATLSVIGRMGSFVAQFVYANMERNLFLLLLITTLNICIAIVAAIHLPRDSLPRD